VTWLLAAALALPLPWYPPGRSPETDDARRDRIALIVESAVAAADVGHPDWPGDDNSLAAAVLAKTWHESRRWAVEVHDGTVRGDRGRSCGLGQVWGGCSAVGTSLAATRAHLHDVARILAHSARQCRVRRIDERTIARVFAMYGTGRTCVPGAWVIPRAHLWTRMMRVG
jgi:hypothetical protein